MNKQSQCAGPQMTQMATDETIFERMIPELRRAPQVELVLKPESAMILSGGMQLLMRHRELPQSARELALKFALSIRSHFEGSGCDQVVAAIDAGWQGTGFDPAIKRLTP